MKNMRRDWMKASLLCIKLGQTAATTVFFASHKGPPLVASSTFFSTLANYHSDSTSASSCPASSLTSTETSLPLLARKEYEFLVCTSPVKKTQSLMPQEARNWHGSSLRDRFVDILVATTCPTLEIPKTQSLDSSRLD